MVFEHTLHRYGQEVTQFKPTFVSIYLTLLSVTKKTQQQSDEVWVLTPYSNQLKLAYNKQEIAHINQLIIQDAKPVLHKHSRSQEGH